MVSPGIWAIFVDTSVYGVVVEVLRCEVSSTFGNFVVMSTWASLPFETITFGFEKTLPSPSCSKALIARRKSSAESCPENPRAVRHDMLSALLPAPAAALMVDGTRPVNVDELLFEEDGELEEEVEVESPPEPDEVVELEEAESESVSVRLRVESFAP